MTSATTAARVPYFHAMLRRLFAHAPLLLAVLALAACGDADQTDGTAPPADRPSIAQADAPALLDDISAQFGRVTDRPSAVVARQAIEVQLRLLRAKLPKAEHAGEPVPSAFAVVLHGKEAAAKELLERADAALAKPDVEPVLGSYVKALRDLLK